ncbi:hypothetical protein Y1Q_0011778 [Alligator mississippiensis]|uniref:Uncharacterized protein n=1 Tax=Alligator mississippiensis TaxID=8496 RepID=A0A151M134_ALLMI|nr:hypothetical protein Y1Q_0011778 [Alligator mississippiensis]
MWLTWTSCCLRGRRHSWAHLGQRLAGEGDSRNSHLPLLLLQLRRTSHVDSQNNFAHLDMRLEQWESPTQSRASL